jgi:hypothetical protein
MLRMLRLTVARCNTGRGRGCESDAKHGPGSRPDSRRDAAPAASLLIVERHQKRGVRGCCAGPGERAPWTDDARGHADTWRLVWREGRGFVNDARGRSYRVVRHARAPNDPAEARGSACVLARGIHGAGPERPRSEDRSGQGGVCVGVSLCGSVRVCGVCAVCGGCEIGLSAARARGGEWVNDWVDGWADGLVDGRVDGRAAGRVDGRVDGRVCSPTQPYHTPHTVAYI